MVSQTCQISRVSKSRCELFPKSSGLYVFLRFFFFQVVVKVEN